MSSSRDAARSSAPYPSTQAAITSIGREDAQDGETTYQLHASPPISPRAKDAPVSLEAAAIGAQSVLSPRSGLDNDEEDAYEEAVKDGERKDDVGAQNEEASCQERAYRRVHVNDPEANEAFGYCCNTVVTSRFTIYNFLPKLLFYEFSKLANAYFLGISIMQTIKPISNTGGFPASLPALSIIVLIDMFFACLEDYKRHQADHVANNLTCHRYSLATQCFEPTKWSDIHVGDVLKIFNREPFPADVVLLGAAEPDPTNPAGICYVETKSLDGETNLKLRQGLEATYTQLKSDADIALLRGEVVCETPNNAIHRFDGTFTMSDGTKEVITTNAIALRGSTLRNTEFMYGLVVNTGPHTKIMMASKDAPMKWSNMEKRLNRQILYICVLMVVLCVTGATAAAIWNHLQLSEKAGRQAWYLYDADNLAVTEPVANYMIQLLYYFLLLNSFIPVSLYVSMTSVKFMQSYFMNNDKEMYHEESDTPCQVRTMSLNEELGQIDYIFTDKTGTLTCNIMEFRKCSINGVAYGLGETEVGIAAKKRRAAEVGYGGVKKEEFDILEEEQDASQHRLVSAPFVNYQDDAIFDALGMLDTQSEAIKKFFEHLSVCHTVMPERANDGSLWLSASSPDEQALVAAAGCFGFRFAARSPGKAIVEYFSCLDPKEQTAPQDTANRARGEYEILEVLEFNSTRKRMSVIVKDPQGGVKLLCKGADTVIYERLRPTSDPGTLHMRNTTLQHMEQFASEGLRTLVIAATDVDPVFYEGWVIQYRAAINDLRQIELRRLGEPNNIDKLMEEMEVNLDILGATAIEDRLQTGVPDTIAKLREASIKIWMLTGDKEETAINIGFACSLLTTQVERIVISADTHPDLPAIVDEMERYLNLVESGAFGPKSEAGSPLTPSGQRGSNATLDVNGNTLDRPLTRLESVVAENATREELALVIDGETLELVLDNCPKLMLQLAQKCVVVIACRVSPAQKAQLVHLVRDNLPEVRTLAIGDGANDVSMIQSAHVGVGISGQEGMQAANSSDYAIAQFRFLGRLLLVHGRWNYVRMGKLILYIFYKNVMMNLTQFWYMIYTGFSGQKFFLEWGLQGYNLLFTALPIVLVSTFEQDVPAHLAENYPLLYRVGQENRHFNTKIVWAWITSCVWESLIISFGTIYGMKNLNDTGETPNMWVYGCVAFTIVVLVVSLKLALHQQMWWFTHAIIYIGSFALWPATAALISAGNSISSAYWNGVFSNVFGATVFWLLLPLITFLALSRDILWKGYMRAFRPSYKHLAQEVHAFKLDHMADKLLTFPPPTEIPRDVESRFTIDQSPRKPIVSTTSTIPGRGRALTHRKSVTRGSAFSYDAESVMVEAYMSSERFNRSRQSTLPVFDRHASRGSIAFHGLPDTLVGSQAFLEHRSSSSNSMTPTSTRGRQGSLGNIFRAARHRSLSRPNTRSDAGRSRFFSVSSSSPVNGTAFVARRMERSMSSGNEGSTPAHFGVQEQQPLAVSDQLDQPVPVVRRNTLRRIERQLSA